jgi:hypothetical protein
LTPSMRTALYNPSSYSTHIPSLPARLGYWAGM